MTGAAGFVGANLVRRLLADGHTVHGLARPGSNLWRLRGLLADVSLHEVNLTDEEKLSALVTSVRPDWIFHLAAYGAYPTQTDFRRMVHTNVLGTGHLLDAALGIGFDAFVNTGSSSEYGLKDRPPAETEALEPNSDYAVTKASATLLSRSRAQRHRAPIRTLRLYSVYGPYEEPARLMPTLIVRGLQGELPPLVRPEIARDFVEVSDVTEAYVLAATVTAQEPGEIYNVGTGVQTSVGQMVTLTQAVFAVGAAPQWGSMPDRVWDTSVWVANSAKIRKQLDWCPSNSEHLPDF